MIFPFICNIFCFLNLSTFYTHCSLSFLIYATFFCLARKIISCFYYFFRWRYFFSSFCLSWSWTFWWKAFSRFFIFSCRSFASFLRCKRFSSLIVWDCLRPSLLYYLSFSLNCFTSRDLSAFYPCFLMLFQIRLSYFFKYSNRLFKAVTSCSYLSRALL